MANVRSWRSPSVEAMAAPLRIPSARGSAGSNASTNDPSAIGFDPPVTEQAPAAATRDQRLRGAVPRRALRGSGVTDPRRARKNRRHCRREARQYSGAGESIANHARRQTLRAFRGRRAKEGFPSQYASLPIVHPLTL
jgi:hypothetical protein